jgi:hypothetical protein
MGIYKVSYSLDERMYAVQVFATQTDEAKGIILREHPEAVIIAVKLVAG